MFPGSWYLRVMGTLALLAALASAPDAATVRTDIAEVFVDDTTSDWTHTMERHDEGGVVHYCATVTPAAGEGGYPGFLFTYTAGGELDAVYAKVGNRWTLFAT